MLLEKFEIRDAKGGPCINMTMDEMSFWAFPGKQINDFVRGLIILLGHDLDVTYTTYNGHKRLEKIVGVN